MTSTVLARQHGVGCLVAER